MADRHGRNELFELSLDLLATFDLDGRFTDCNPAAERMLGYPREELIGRRVADLVHPQDRERTLEVVNSSRSDTEVVEFENRYRCQDGSYRWLEWNARRVDGNWYAVARDVSERHGAEQRALRDPLTGLGNRGVLAQRLQEALARIERDHRMVAVLFIDLDNFKLINDGRGHEIGDRALQAAAVRLAGTVRSGDTVVRLGGDEFVVLLEGLEHPAEVTDVAARLLGTLRSPVRIEAEGVSLHASIGIALAASARASSEALLREADIAMYRAKAAGGDCFAVFDDAVRAEVDRRMTVERELRAAVDEGSFAVHYQPIVALPETSVSRLEALVRWQHPSRGLLLPEDFLPLAEETGLIVPIGAAVLAEACAQAQRWRRRAHGVTIMVNVSTRQLDRPEFVEVVTRVLSDTGLPPSALCLEITETEMVKHIERVAPQLEALRRAGVRIAMDDFGSGYSSLGYLRTLPLDTIKVDKSFVAGIVDDVQDRAIVAAIVKLGRATEREVIAEGVETEPLHAELLGLDCDLAQGFLYAAPAPASELSLDGYSSRLGPGIGDPLVVREFMRQIGIPARVQR